jgi:gluconate 5-dehydrogenase
MQTVGYNSSKRAIISMTRDLATSWARHNITVNATATGLVPHSHERRAHRAVRKEMLAGIPLGRFGNPEDLKGVVIFLSSPAASYVTGQTVVVDGGATEW